MKSSAANVQSLCSQARLRLLPHKTGQLNIVGVMYNLAAVPSGDVDPSTDGKCVQMCHPIEVKLRENKSA